MITLKLASEIALRVDHDDYTHDIGDVEWADQIVEGKRVIAFQGSASVADWVGNAVAFKTNFTGARVHTGFLHQALQAYAAIHGVPHLLIGHSLGGAIAQLLAAKWGIPCITFGSPRVGNRTFADIVEPLHTRVVHAGDPVVHVPFACWGFRHGGNEVKLGERKFPWPKWHSMEIYHGALR